MGWQGDALKIKVRAAPENGRANAAVVEVLAKALGLPKSALTLESGESSRHKRVCIRGLALVDVKKRLDAALAA